MLVRAVSCHVPAVAVLCLIGLLTPVPTFAYEKDFEEEGATKVVRSEKDLKDIKDKVTTLEFSGVDLSEWSFVGNLENVSSMRFISCKWTDDSTFIKWLGTQSSLKSIEFHKNDLSNSIAESVVEKCKNLKCLSMLRESKLDSGLLKSQIVSREWELLSFSLCPGFEAGDWELLGKATIVKLRILGEISPSAFIKLLTINNIEYLCVYGEKITEGKYENIRVESSLKELTLSYLKKFTVELATTVASLANLEKLSFLETRGFEKDAIQAVCEMDLEFIEFSGGVFNDENIAAMEGKEYNIGRIELSLLDITDAGLRSLSKVRGIPEIELYALDMISNSGLQSVVDIPGLQYLHVAGCKKITPSLQSDFRKKNPKMDILIRK